MPHDLLVQLLVKGAVGAAGFVVSRQFRHQQNEKLQNDILTTNLVQSVTCLQQGIELLTEYLELNDNTSINYGRDKKWIFLVKEVIKVSSMENFILIPRVCFALKEVIPYLFLMKNKVDPGNQAFARAKEAFQCSSLVASAVFQSTEVRNFQQLLYYSLATVMRVNAAILQYFTSPELLATVISGHIEQLQVYSRGWVGKVQKTKGLYKFAIMNCLDGLLALAVCLTLNLKPEVQEQFSEDLRAYQSSGLFNLVSKYCLISQISFGQQGVNDEDLDGPTSIAVNSEGLVIVADSRNQKIKAKTATGKVIWQCEPLPGDSGSNVPLAIATNQHDEIFAIFYNESRNVNTIVKFNPNGRFLCGLGDLGQDMIPCGMSVNSNGLIYLGDEGNGRIYILEPDGASLSTRKVIRRPDLESHFSFCLGPNDKLIVATRKGVVILHEDGNELKKITLNWHKACKVKKWKPLAIAYDADLKHVLITTAGEISSTSKYFSSKTVNLKPMLWFLSAEPYALLSTVEFPLRDIDDTNGRFDMVASKQGLWCVTEATHRIHCFTMMYHAIKP